MKTTHTLAGVAAILSSAALSAASAPPVAKVLVTNPVVPVEIRNANPLVVQSPPEGTPTRYGPVFSQSNDELVELVPPVATGKKFVVTYVATVLNTNNSAFPLVTGRCGIIVVNPQAVLNPIVAAVPLDADLNGSLQLFLPLNAGESLELTCSGLAANSVRPPQSFRGVVGGYSVPAS